MWWVLACGRVRTPADAAEGRAPDERGDGAAAREGTVATDYGAAYYNHYTDAGTTYDHSKPWTDFFGSVAERLVQDFHPATALDAGCAIGLLVEALRDRGVEAEGLDFSEFAITQSREDIRGFLRVGSITDPLPKRYDLITCFEVLEHLSPRDAERAIANLCAFTDQLVVSTTPIHFRDPTHTNIHPQEYWTERFARHGFIRDVDYDAGYIAPWAARYRRSSDPLHRVLADYDRAYSRMRHELQERNALVLEQMRQLSDLKDEVRRLQDRPGVRLARRVDDAAVKAAPRGTKRGDLLRSAAQAVRRRGRRPPAP